MAAEVTFAMRAAVLTEQGRRPQNEDAVLTAVVGGGMELVAVADGMGGYAGGAEASRCALEELRAQLDGGAGLEDAVRAANRAVFHAANGAEARSGMGTTLVALLRSGATYRIANVGDSRAYRIDGSGVAQLTQDHSFIAEAVRSGLLSLEEAGRSRWRNAVTRAVGTDPELEAVDCFGPFDATEPHAVLLCTDGLYRVLAAEQLGAAAAGAPAAAARSLVSAAYEAGSDDNISAAVVHFAAAAELAAVEPTPEAPVVAAVEPTPEAPVLAAPAEQAAPETEPAATRGSAEPAAYAPERRRRGRGRRRHDHRWTSIELVILALGLTAVAVYVALLVLAF